MTQKTRRAPLTDAEREQRRQAERELLTAAVAQLKTSEGWLRWLTVRKAFTPTRWLSRVADVASV